MALTAEEIQDNLEAIRDRMRMAARQSGRPVDDICLIAISKYMPPEYVQSAMSAGQHCFGENTVQDALTKQALIDDPDNEWHFVGHLQSNKAKMIPGNFDWLHTLDSLKLATRLSESALKSACILNVLLQVNIADDRDKFGLPASAVFRFIDDLLNAGLDGIRLRGLMTIGRRDAALDERRTDFSALRELRDRCAARFDLAGFSELSMGMSGDFEAAIAEGATLIRVGSALFGPRRAVVTGPVEN
jgi:pyridoxal phosphate enzyme (YggS family)